MLGARWPKWRPVGIAAVCQSHINGSETLAASGATCARPVPPSRAALAARGVDGDPPPLVVRQDFRLPRLGLVLPRAEVGERLPWRRIRRASRRRAVERGSGEIHRPWVPRINSAFTSSFYGNHVRRRPSVAASAPILVYIARVTCISMKKTGRVRKEARSKVIADFARWRTRNCPSYFRCLQLPHAGGHSFEEAHATSAVSSGEHPPFWSRLRRLVGPARRIHTCRACSFSELNRGNRSHWRVIPTAAIGGPLFG
jgi:hypothetical protein